jgi:hypothetical protein
MLAELVCYYGVLEAVASVVGVFVGAYSVDRKGF